MPLAEDIRFVCQLVDAYAVEADRKGVASTRPQDSGVPAAMQVGPIDAYGWVEWRVLPSTLSEVDVTELENKFGVHLPPLFRAYLLARFHLFDQVTSRRHDQLILMTDTPAGKPLAPLLHLMSGPWRLLIDAGFIPFAEWGDGWGPMCFDADRRTAEGDCPIVWMDHEILAPLGEQCRRREKVMPLAQPVYETFREMLTDVFGRS